MLNSAVIIAEAEARAGIGDSEAVYRVNLERLIDSLNVDAHLPAWGEASAQRALVDRTADRCWISCSGISIASSRFAAALQAAV
jgi:hypothetical protein